MRPSGPATGAKALSSKPNFGFSSKKGGGAFAKPTFAMGGGGTKKTGPTIVPKANISGASGSLQMSLKRKQMDDDFIESEMQQIQSSNLHQDRPMASNFEDSEDPAQDSYASPDRQLPFSMSGENGVGGAAGMQQSYAPTSNGQGGDFRSPATESRSRIATMAYGDA